jgi:hypothetical protein
MKRITIQLTEDQARTIVASLEAGLHHWRSKRNSPATNEMLDKEDAFLQRIIAKLAKS